MSTAISGIILASAFDLYVSSAKNSLGQTDVIDMQVQVQASMNLMVSELRLMYGLPTISNTVSANDTISFSRVEDSGLSSGGNSASRLNDSNKS